MIIILSFGEEIKRIRNEKKLSLKDVEEISGISHSYLSQIENGKRNAPKPDMMKKLSKGLNTPYTDLMKLAGYGGKENPIPSDSFFDLLSSEEKEVYINNQSRHIDIKEYRKINHPDIKEFLSENEVYYDMKKLNQADKVMAKNILDSLFKDLEVNYPKLKDIEAEYDKIIKAAEIYKKRDKNKKEGD